MTWACHSLIPRFSYKMGVDAIISGLEDNIVYSYILRLNSVSLKGKCFSVCGVNLPNFMHSNKSSCRTSQDKGSKLIYVSLFR